MIREGHIERDTEGKPARLYLSSRLTEVPRRYKRGDRVIAFDAEAWRPVGDIGDNSCFWKPATVLHFYWKDGEWLVDLLFDGGSESRGHFASGVKPMVKE